MPNQSVLEPANRAGAARVGSVRLFGECKHFYSITVLTVSKVTNVRQANVQSSQSVAEEYYECRTNDFILQRYNGQCVDRLTLVLLTMVLKIFLYIS